MGNGHKIQFKKRISAVKESVYKQEITFTIYNITFTRDTFSGQWVILFVLVRRRQTKKAT